MKVPLYSNIGFCNTGNLQLIVTLMTKIAADDIF